MVCCSSRLCVEDEGGKKREKKNNTQLYRNNCFLVKIGTSEVF
jgi:hypothetical protein